MKRKAAEEESNDDTTLREVSVRKRINFDQESDSEEEVFFDTQAHKRRKMGKDTDELKIWIAQQFKEKMSGLATHNQTQDLVKSINDTRNRVEKNEDNILSLIHI